MCEFCESQDAAHSLDHAFLKIRRPEADPVLIKDVVVGGNASDLIVPD